MCPIFAHGNVNVCYESSKLALTVLQGPFVPMVTGFAPYEIILNF